MGDITCAQFTLLLLCASSVLSVKQLMVDENEIFSIDCAPDEGIQVRKAMWSVVNCELNVTDDMIRLCNGKIACNLWADRETFGGDCYSRMNLNVKYDCITCPTTHSMRKRWIGGYADKVREFGPLFIGTCDLMFRLAIRHVAYDCPHFNFEAKHVCSTCQDSPAGASLFSAQTANARDYGHTSSTNVNSVFMAGSTTTVYEDDAANDRCRFNRFLPKYDCTVAHSHANSVGIWNCQRVGIVKATHIKSTGHYLHGDDQIMYG